MKTPEEILETKRRYRNSERGKMKALQYSQTPQFRERQRLYGIEYRKTDKYKIASKNRQNSENYKRYQSEYNRDHLDTELHRKQDWNTYLIRRYKITSEQYDIILKKQNGRCAICSSLPGKNRLSVDHNHSCCKGSKSCGKCIRKLLCIKCNLMLGASRDSISNLKSAIAYLEEYNVR